MLGVLELRTEVEAISSTSGTDLSLNDSPTLQLSPHDGPDTFDWSRRGLDWCAKDQTPYPVDHCTLSSAEVRGEGSNGMNQKTPSEELRVDPVYGMSQDRIMLQSEEKTAPSISKTFQKHLVERAERGLGVVVRRP